VSGNKAQIGVLQILIILVTLFTAAVHLYLGQLWSYPIFILNGLGYLGLLGALFLPIPIIREYHSVWRWLLAGFAALTIVLYFVVNGLAGALGIAIATKVAEVVLIVLLVLDSRKTS
jgi:hypothetical protein